MQYEDLISSSLLVFSTTSEKNFKDKLNNFEDEFYSKIYNLISEAKRKEEEEIAASSEIMKKLLVVEKKLEIVRREIASMSR